jgi:hypothetical protein
MLELLSPLLAVSLVALHRSYRSATKGAQLGNARLNGWYLRHSRPLAAIDPMIDMLRCSFLKADAGGEAQHFD